MRSASVDRLDTCVQPCFDMLVLFVFRYPFFHVLEAKGNNILVGSVLEALVYEKMLTTTSAWQSFRSDN